MSGTDQPRPRKGGGGRGERAMVPDATFESYYGRPIVRKAPWKWDIAAYFFTGGVMAGSSLLAAGADLTGNASLRRATRLSAVAALAASTYFLVHDLGRPSRFYNMLRVAKPTSPMSVGTWLLAAYGPAAGLAAASEVTGLLPTVGTAAGLGAAAVAPAIATYTAVLVAQTAMPAWSEAHPDLQHVFAGSAAAASGGLAMALVPPGSAQPARRLAVAGALSELAATERMEHRLPVYGEGRAGRFGKAAKALTAAGAALTLLGGKRRPVAIAAGAALLAGSACTRMSVFHAGRQSADDPKHVVEPQRARLAERSRPC